MIKYHHNGVRGERRSTWTGVHLGQASRGPFDPRWLDNDTLSLPPTESAYVILPARRACRREAVESQRHCEGPLPCASPRCAHLPEASREPRPRRSPPCRPGREPATIGVVSTQVARPAAKRRDFRLPLNNHRSGDQRHKKDRRQDRGCQPLTKIESVGIWHMTAFGFRRERKALSHR